MTHAFFQVSDIAEAATQAALRIGKDRTDFPDDHPEWHRTVMLSSLAQAAARHGEPTMAISPEDWRLIANGFHQIIRDRD